MMDLIRFGSTTIFKGPEREKAKLALGYATELLKEGVPVAMDQFNQVHTDKELLSFIDGDENKKELTTSPNKVLGRFADKMVDEKVTRLLGFINYLRYPQWALGATFLYGDQPKEVRKQIEKEFAGDALKAAAEQIITLYAPNDNKDRAAIPLQPIQVTAIPEKLDKAFREAVKLSLIA